MNIYDYEVLKYFVKNVYTNQRNIANETKFSLGKINQTIRFLKINEYLTDDFFLTDKTKSMIDKRRPQNAIILAAGFGMRMVPINSDVPKGLVEVHGQPLIERLIIQLQEVDIFDIHIVVGYMKEKYEYLIDKFNVKLIYNPEYSSKNNLHSLNLVADNLSNTYIMPCDIWAKKNPFSKNEMYSWYAVTRKTLPDSVLKISRQRKINLTNKHGNSMLGIAFLLENESSILREKIKEMVNDDKNDDKFWEDALFNYEYDKSLFARLYEIDEVVEINTYEQLRELDEKSNNLSSYTIDLIVDTLKTHRDEIHNIRVLKKGMTNRSFIFTVGFKNYIMRIPGEGTDRLINRDNEFKVYQKLKKYNISDNVLYFSQKTGYKITEYIEDARVPDPYKNDDIKLCMIELKKFHQLNLKVSHTFNLFERIEFYEGLREGKASIFRDYEETKTKVFSLKSVIDGIPKEWVLSHIDAVPDNFLFTPKGVKLIDWEYASMQDPHIDIAMFAVYAMYDRVHVDRLINFYFEMSCPDEIRLKIYSYIAICGLLWSNWCEFKRIHGVEFGEYSLRQYRYAKEYYEIVQKSFFKTKFLASEDM